MKIRIEKPEEENLLSEDGVTWQTKITDIPPIPVSRADGFGRDEIKNIVELPLRKICLELYDKGIRTLDSTANSSNLGREAGFSVEISSLSEKNKSIIQELARQHPEHISVGSTDEWGPVAVFSVPLAADSEMTAGEIDAILTKFTNGLENQVANWIEHYNWDDFIAALGELHPDLRDKDKHFIAAFYGKFYNAETNCIFPNEELAIKYLDSLKNQKNEGRRIKLISTKKRGQHIRILNPE